MRRIAEEFEILLLRFCIYLAGVLSEDECKLAEIRRHMINYQTCRDSVSDSPRTIRVALILPEIRWLCCTMMGGMPVARYAAS